MKLIFRKIFKKRRSDVSLLFFSRMVFILLIQKFINFFNRREVNNKSCTIIFPPSLGMGDLISLSRIIDLANNSNQFNAIYVLHFCPFVQKKIPGIKYIRNLDNCGYINSSIFIFPTPSKLNKLIGIILGIDKCRGYFSKNITNFKTKADYKINEYDEPYFYRLKPFLDYFKASGEIKPYIWRDKDIIEFEENDYSTKFLKIENIKKDSKLIVINTYNFYKKFRPKKNIILNSINQLFLSSKKVIVILGGSAEKEISYNKSIENHLKQSNQGLTIINLTSLLSLKSSIKVILESNFYIGANNGLGNVSQMLGKESIILFTKCEKIIKRKFSQSSSFINTD